MARFDEDFFRERFMCGERDLTWSLMIQNGAAPRPILFVANTEFAIDINKRELINIFKDEFEFISVDYAEKENGFTLTTTEHSDYFAKNVQFVYFCEELLYLYRNDNIVTASNAHKL